MSASLCPRCYEPITAANPIAEFPVTVRATLRHFMEPKEWAFDDEASLATRTIEACAECRRGHLIANALLRLNLNRPDGAYAELCVLFGVAPSASVVGRVAS